MSGFRAGSADPDGVSAVDTSRVLIVEDDEDIASLVRRTLSAAGIESDTASTGADGLWMARESTFGVMLLDIMLPEMNGWEVCRTLREEKNPVPILMLTAKSGEYDELDGLELGADDYLRKPFNPEILVARVRALLRRTPVIRSEAVLQRGAVAFDLRSRTCTLDDEVVSLTSKEAALLELLLRADEQPLPRAEVLRQVWGMEFDGDPNVVDVYVGYLRKKLGRHTIETLRGVGFRVRA